MHRHWFEANWSRILWLGIGTLSGLVLGWWGGSFTACSQSESGCEVRVQAIEAVGTWVGGLGTVLAVGAAVVAFRSEEESRRVNEYRIAAREKAALSRTISDAQSVSVTATVGAWSDETVSELKFLVKNGSGSTDAYNIVLTHRLFHTILTSHRVEAGSEITGRVRLDPTEKISLAAREVWIRDQIADTRLEFEMSGIRWERIGLSESRVCS